MPESYLGTEDYTRILLPLSKVPHIMLSGQQTSFIGPGISGFEVDTNGDLFFLGGEPEAEIVKISTDGQILFRRILENQDERSFTGLRLFDQHLVTFDRITQRPSIQQRRSSILLILDAVTGETIQPSVPVIDSLNIAVLTYNSSCIVVRLMDNSLYRLNLKGELVGETTNVYGLSRDQYPPRIVQEHPDREGYGQLNFVGQMGPYLLFYDLVGDKPQDSYWFFWIEGDDGIIPANFRIPPHPTEDGLRRPMSGNPDANWFLRNNVLYYLGSRGNNIEIVTIPIEKLFPEIPRLSRVSDRIIPYN